MILVFFGCGAVKDKLVTFGYCQLFFVWWRRCCLVLVVDFHVAFGEL
jgi:hypothetical protein